MAGIKKTLTTREYARRTGLSVSTITQMLRDGRLHGEKRGGKWAIDVDEAISQVAAANPDRSSSTHRAAASTETRASVSANEDRHLDVASFARLTYLTEKGVRQWFKAGRLSGSVDADGNPLVDATNLDRPDFRHLVRK